MKKLRNKKVIKMRVKDLKKMLKGADDESEVVLTFYMKDKGLYSVYLAQVLSNLAYDGVVKEQLYDSKICELSGFNHEYCDYKERDE